MYPAVHALFETFTAKFEGSVQFMYLDSLGLVTTGRGNLIDASGEPTIGEPYAPALTLRWTLRDGRVASQAEVIAEWQRVKALQPMKSAGGGAFAKGAQLLVAADSLEQLIEEKLTENEGELRQLLAGYDDFPADAQLAILDMAWAMGPEFPHGYPHWRVAVVGGDWVTAAAECAIDHPDPKVNASIAARNAANALLFRNAAQVVARALPRDAVYFPRDLTAEAKSGA